MLGKKFGHLSTALARRTVSLTLGVFHVTNAKSEALAILRDAVLHESGVLRGDDASSLRTMPALGHNALLERQWVVLRRREELAVQLPAVDNLVANVQAISCSIVLKIVSLPKSGLLPRTRHQYESTQSQLVARDRLLSTSRTSCPAVLRLADLIYSKSGRPLRSPSCSLAQALY